MFNDNICGFGYMTKSGMPGNKHIIVSGTGSLFLPHISPDKADYITVCGNTVQDDPSPTLDDPSDIRSFGRLVTDGEHNGQYQILLTFTGRYSAVIPLYLDAPLMKVGNQSDRLIVDFKSHTIAVERRIIYCSAPHGVMYGSWAKNRSSFGGILKNGDVHFFSSSRAYDNGFCTHMKTRKPNTSPDHELNTIAFGTYSHILLYYQSSFFDEALSDYGASNLNAWLDENKMMIAYVSDTTYDTNEPYAIKDISSLQQGFPSFRPGSYSLSVSDCSDLEPSNISVSYTSVL